MIKVASLIDYSITMEKISYGGYSLRLTSPNGNASVFCNESWIFDDLDDESPEIRLKAVNAALRRFVSF